MAKVRSIFIYWHDFETPIQLKSSRREVLDSSSLAVYAVDNHKMSLIFDAYVMGHEGPDVSGSEE